MYVCFLIKYIDINILTNIARHIEMYNIDIFYKLENTEI